MSQENFWVLISKKLSGEASFAELKELENLVREHPEWQYAIQNLEDLWKHQPVKNDTAGEDAYLLHLHRMKDKNIPFGETPGNTVLISKKKVIKWYWAAALFLLAAGLIAFGILFNKENTKSLAATREVNEVTTHPGSRSKLQLPDGSVVWLNAGSRLTYKKEFGQQLREVMLTGEGYFDVVKMEDRPFLIHTSSITIKVLGTAFNVKAYPDDRQTETSLIRGSIEVTIKNRPDNKIILSPDEKLVVQNESFSTSKNKLTQTAQPAISISTLRHNPDDSTVAETQWVENKLVFNDESFAEVAVRMERWYDVEIELNDPQLLPKRLTGNFEKETIEQALEALKISIPFKHEHTGSKIIIHH